MNKSMGIILTGHNIRTSTLYLNVNDYLNYIINDKNLNNKNIRKIIANDIIGFRKNRDFVAFMKDNLDNINCLEEIKNELKLALINYCDLFYNINTTNDKLTSYTAKHNYEFLGDCSSNQLKHYNRIVQDMDEWKELDIIYNIEKYQDWGY